MSDALFAPGAFDEFYFAVHDRKPFAWQTRLAHHVCRTLSKKDTEDPWPTALDVPTGAGKTSAIDVAIFHLAREVARVEACPGTPRVAALRIFFVVDRRLVVDDAFRHAQKLAHKLKGAQSGVLAAAARNLLKLAEFGSPDAEPLNVTRLRGGAPKDYDWVRSPSQPTVVLSTVDQVGSRLLFRGYGVSDGMKPVHAALVGNDALVLLDEAHLSNPFVGTLRSIASQRRRQTPFQVVTLSATQKGASHEFIEPKDLEDVSPGSLGRRLRCAKRARLVLVKENKAPAANATQFVKEFVRAARYHLDDPDAQAVAVVVNRVRRARAIFEELTRELREQAAPIDVILLTGRSRPLDRDELLATNRKRIATDPNRVPATRRIVVVATQCVEAGADLDFDALITEVAPLDALRQRFGRLHRLGRPVDATVTKRPSATILACGDQTASRAKPDPIYGNALRATWELLSQKASKPSEGRKKRTTDETVADDAPTIDFGVANSKGWLPQRGDLTPYLAPAGSAEGPLLTPSFLSQWACTSPIPAAEADVSLFLHGKQSGPGDVQIVWRADLDDRRPPETWAERVAVCPPSSLEALAVPYFEAQRWLAKRATAEIGDVEGTSGDDLGEQSRLSERVGRAALRWRGKDDAQPVSRRTPISPGDTIVVPATYGGADRWGWWPVDERTGNTDGDPSAKRGHHNTRPTQVTDLGDIANRLHRRSDILRLSPLLLGLARRDELIEDDEPPIEAEKRAALARRAFERLFAQRTEDGNVSVAELTREALKELLLDFDELPRAWRAWLVRDDAFRVHRSEDDVPLALERKLSLDETRSLTPAHAAEASAPQGERRTTLSTDADDDLDSEGTDGDLGGEATTEDDESSLPAPRTGRVARKVSVLLSQHSKGVGDIAKTMALLAGFPEDRVEDIALAGFLHDAGKAHPDFQALLFGGDEIAAELARVSGKALAKSGRLKLDRAARDRAKLPAGARHEVASLWLALAHPAFAKAHDRDLVLWLVGTHHGHGRPFFPAVEWPRAGDTFIASLDEGAEVASQPAASLASLTARWPALYERLSRELGLWELAYCEAVVRLADHRVSELEQRADAPNNISTRPTTRRSAHASSLQAREEDRP